MAYRNRFSSNRTLAEWAQQEDMEFMQNVVWRSKQ